MFPAHPRQSKFQVIGEGAGADLTGAVGFGDPSVPLRAGVFNGDDGHKGKDEG